MFTNAGAALNGAFAGEPAVDVIAAAVTRRWQEVYTAGTETTPVFRPLDLPTLLLGESASRHHGLLDGRSRPGHRL